VILTATVAGESRRVEVRAVDGGYLAVVGDRSFSVDYVESAEGLASLLVAGRSRDVALERRPWGYVVTTGVRRYEVAIADAAPTASHVPADGGTRLTAPMPGKVVRVLVEAGQHVAAKQGLVVVEAMKMENELKAAREGTVRAVHVREGQAVEGGALLLVVE
jgi:glutaconyl-CoA/methylmalonyl-CoA decarboxylase subunit gamma